MILAIMPQSCYDDAMIINRSAADQITCMRAMRDLARYIADSADHQLRATDHPAFLDDNSDYLPAALELMRDLMIALTDDDADIASSALIARIAADQSMITNDDIRYSELPLDAPCDLPIIDLD